MIFGVKQDNEDSKALLESRSSPVIFSSSFALFNDLTYSDDDDTDEWDGGELGTGSFSSPDVEAATMMDDVQNPISPSLQQPPMHPLARLESHHSDEGSFLAYSISSLPGDDETKTSHVTTYGSTEALDFKSKAAAVIFRPSSLGFDHSSRPKPQQQQQQQKYQQYQQQQTKQYLATTPKSITSENSRYNKTTKSTNRKQSPHKSSCYAPATPLPSRDNESPATSATATDTTLSPTSETKPHPEKERIARLLSVEATKKLRRHKRLKRIKKAAEAREAAVQKVRGVEQDPTGCNDALFAYIFLCQLFLVSASAMLFGQGALRDKIYASMGIDEKNNGGEVEDYNPFAGLQVDDVIITYRPSHSEETSIEESSTGISHIDYINVIQLACIASGYASLSSLLALGFMMMLSKNLLHAVLIFTIVVSMLWTLLGLTCSSYSFIPIIGFFALALSSFYTVVVWDRIPFAATNLSVALKGMRSTLDIPFVGFCILVVSFLWTIWWICAFIGVFNFVNDVDDLSNNWMSVVRVFFLFSYFWTIEVMKVSYCRHAMLEY